MNRESYFLDWKLFSFFSVLCTIDEENYLVPSPLFESLILFRMYQNLVTLLVYGSLKISLEIKTFWEIFLIFPA